MLIRTGNTRPENRPANHLIRHHFTSGRKPPYAMRCGSKIMASGFINGPTRSGILGSDSTFLLTASRPREIRTRPIRRRRFPLPLRKQDSETVGSLHATCRRRRTPRNPKRRVPCRSWRLFLRAMATMCQLPALMAWYDRARVTETGSTTTPPIPPIIRDSRAFCSG